MSLSNSVKTWIIDPTVNNTSRTEFRLPDAFWSSSIRLIDLGVYDAQATDNTGLYYPSINGVLAAVRKLTLYSGSTIIDEIQELPAYASIQHLRTSNQGSEDINRFELLNGNNVALSADDCWTYTSKWKDYRQEYQDLTAQGQGNIRSHNQFQVARQALDQTSGAINLNDYLEFLKSVPVLPKLPDLRLVVDWNTTAADYYQDPDAGTAVAAPSYTPIRPSLICDEILGVADQGSDYKLPYLANIVERFVVPAPGGAVGDARRDSFRSGAFKNRYVKDLTFFNKVTTDQGWMLAKQRSPCMRGEKLQLVVNGAKYLPDQGIDQEAQKLAYFNDTHGSLNLPTPAYLEGVADISGRVLCLTDNADASHSSAVMAHNYSVTAVRVEDTVDRLDVEYQRENGANESQNSEFTLLCFGRCAKQLEVKGGNLRISY